MNMEIERYALVRGESVFVGFARKMKLLPYWFLISTFLPWIWPGIAASSAKLFGHLLGVEQTQYLAIAFLLLMGLILSFGSVLYKTVVRMQKVLIAVGVPSIFLLSIVLAQRSDFISLAKGMVGIGIGYSFLPIGIPIASFLAALAYAGAGGNLNLAQSFYVKDKGYGMGRYAGKIRNLLSGSSEKIDLTGSTFIVDDTSLPNFKKWWRSVNIEHLVVFWLTGSVTILLLALLSYVTTHSLGLRASDISFVIYESAEIGRRLFPFAGTFFLIVAGATLFGTQLTVLDATSRILTENLSIIKDEKSGISSRFVTKTYYSVLWLQIGAGIIIFLLGFTEPLQLLITAAVLNAFAMFVHVGLTLWLNITLLEKELKPSALRVAAMIVAFLFYGGFSAYTIINALLS